MLFLHFLLRPICIYPDISSSINIYAGTGAEVHELENINMKIL